MKHNIYNKSGAYLKMSRLSNLPTVWTNGLVGLLFAQAYLATNELLLLLSLSLYYIAGMFLNDACDHKIDSIERPERPIPQKIVGLKEAYFIVFILFCGANLLLWWISKENSFFYGIILTLAIVIYDFWHKGNPFSPFIMALCRFMVYIVAASIVLPVLPYDIIVIAATLACYIVGLTFIARQENLKQIKNIWPVLFLVAPVVYSLCHISLWSYGTIVLVLLLIWIIYCIYLIYHRNIGTAVGNLIAGISLVDALFITSIDGSGWWFLVAIAGFILTLIAHRFIPGT